MLVWTLVVAGIIFALVSLAFYADWREAAGNLSLERLRLFLDIYKALGVGVLVAILGAIIPQILPEARDRFRRFKDSRVAYSEAKTSIIYLPEKLASLPFSEAVLALEHAHKRLHLAETFSEELRGHLAWHPHPETWVDRNYWDLMALRRVLRSNAEIWSTMSTAERLRAGENATALVEEVFGPDGHRWKSQHDRQTREAEIAKRIEASGRPALERPAAKLNTA